MPPPIENAVSRRAQRLRSLPRPEFSGDLPIHEKREEIAAAIAAHQVLIVCGETGSGKTTQLPKICLALQRGLDGMIAHTQPRRIAARTVAARIAQELRDEVGRGVGYKVRFTDKVSPATYLKLMTDGILLAETLSDRELSAYDTIIIDEAHERSLNIDFLLGYIKQLLPRRPELKLIITSATIDARRFARHFGDAPVIEVSGRTYPVEVRYRPHDIDDEDAEEQDMPQAIVDAVDELARQPGDILVFLPGEREIRETAEALRKHHPARAEILPLFARLSTTDQERVFRPAGTKRIVLATNVAETSLTVPGIGAVIDTGSARIKRYSYRNKVEQLRVEKIARASCDQRKGRCGRVMSGVCIRLYAEEDYLARGEYTDPEILRTSLAAVILRMKALQLDEIEQFPFLDPPAPKMIADGYQLLMELGAVDEEKRLTKIGAQLARLPLDPRIARMILAAKEENCLDEVLIITAALSVQDARERPFENQQAADEAHRQFHDERSDFLSYLKLWRFFEDAVKHKKSNKKLIEHCHEHFLSWRRLREWREIHGQLLQLAAEMDFRPNQIAAGYEEMHRALLTGLLGNIGMKNEDDEYLGARAIKFRIFPGSGQIKKKPKWLVAAELTETTRLYARGVAKIEPEWLEKIAQHLIKRHYFDPHWEKDAGQVVAFERVTLYGLTIVGKRRVHYGHINPLEAREILIRQALVTGEWQRELPFLAHNRKLIEEIQQLEHKARRQDVLVSDEDIFRFYDARVPQGIVNAAGFVKWHDAARQADAQLLFLGREHLMRHTAAGITEQQFPEKFVQNDIELKLTYRFEPGHALDGVTCHVPLHVLNRLDAARFEWLVPGLIREKITFYFKSLPKALRRAVVPVPQFVTRCLETVLAGEKPLAQALAEFLKRETRLEGSAEIWDGLALPAHLMMNFCVMDDKNQELASGRDLAVLKQQLGQAAQLTFGNADTGIERDHITRWDFGDLPEKIAFTRGGQKLTGYPALTDEEGGVALRLFDRADIAQAAQRAGVRRLLRLELKEHLKQLEKNLPQFNQVALQLRPIMAADALREDLLTAITDRAFIGEDALPRSEKAFHEQKARARTRLAAVTEVALRMTQAIAEAMHELQARLVKADARLARELRAQLEQLIYPGCFSRTPWPQLQHLPRYLKAMGVRLEKYRNAPERDAKHGAAVAGLWLRYQERAEKQRRAGLEDTNLEQFRWMLEELRVSLFAQELRTPYPVSVKRLQKQWEKIRS
ncbi:MAG: ATP-dependent RNA helicase HrpA [Burkholderiales bacterium]